jgi:hypothetical protein
VAETDEMTVDERRKHLQRQCPRYERADRAGWGQLLSEMEMVTDPHRVETQYRSPQRELWVPGTVEWHLVRRVPNYALRHSRVGSTPLVQGSLVA